MSQKVIIYTKDYCPYCSKAKDLLTSKGVSYQEIDVTNDPALQAAMIEKAGGRRTVPQIFIGDFHVGGCDDLYDLDRQGELDKKLKLEASAETGREHHKVIILGSGPAGYTAAIYAARANLAPVIISGPQKGGQLTTTTEVENFPGFPDGVDGNQLMVNMEAQAKRFETKIIFGEVVKADLSKRPFVLTTADDKVYSCDALIVATGATARYLGLPSETKYKNRGVSACATCDGFFFKNQDVAVIGGGDTALEEANYLTNFCKKVYLIHRRDEFRASKAMQDRTFKNPKIEVVWDSTVDEVIGQEPQGMTDLRIKNLKTGATRNLGTTGMFVAIGHVPNTGIFKGQLEMDEVGYLLVQGNSSRTNKAGVFACGDAMDATYRQAITAAGTGCRAAMDAERWLAEQE